MSFTSKENDFDGSASLPATCLVSVRDPPCLVLVNDTVDSPSMMDCSSVSFEELEAVSLPFAVIEYEAAKPPSFTSFTV